MNWVYYRNPHGSKQWLGPLQPAKVFVKKTIRPKVVLCVWWKFADVIHWEFFFQTGGSPSGSLFSTERVHKILRWRYPALVNRNRVLLQQDNARPHTARITMIKIQKLGGIHYWYHTQSTVLFLGLQIAICLCPWPIACVREISITF